MVAIVNCPTCGKKVEWTEANKYRPFCSHRCKQIDLGAWAEEKYVIPSVEPVDDEESDGNSPS
ncbi:DNA gyrase inhibitor YacG|uniref:DNA gyrase inhibitor YacG n=1 Tax=Noviherbaspirillum sp. L7-7A TaxID=2850560 RepID=UPI001C2CB192|nr:DNA gyrase inhibitor YacG [Noviherbaspirillum sp. L7-7A]MBV0877826.1 DNA gyrase inhibitor YacG [Noviherbaspirillum sp. L7-7A]